jgi:hypothetical protein
MGISVKSHLPSEKFINEVVTVYQPADVRQTAARLPRTAQRKTRDLQLVKTQDLPDAMLCRQVSWTAATQRRVRPGLGPGVQAGTQSGTDRRCSTCDNQSGLS